MLVSRGLGTDLRVDCSSGNTIDCDSWSNFFNSTCWGLCSAGGTQNTTAVGTPAAPVTNCSQTIFTSIPGLCDWYVYSAVAIITGLVIFKAI